MRTATQHWRDICSMLKNFEELSGSSQDLYSAFCKWLRDNRNHFDKKTWEAYGFDKYISLNPSLYVAEFTEGTVKDNVERFARNKPNSIDTLGMFIRDILWDIIVFKTNIAVWSKNIDSSSKRSIDGFHEQYQYVKLKKFRIYLTL